MKHKEQSIRQRINNLKKLITDSKGMAFNPLLVFGYQKELNSLEREQTADKNKRIEFNKKNNGN